MMAMALLTSPVTASEQLEPYTDLIWRLLYMGRADDLKHTWDSLI